MKRFKTENEIYDLVKGFESSTIARDEWKHAEHLTVGLYLVMNYDLETAIEKMREGLLNLLQVQGVNLKKEMPYHETLTVFWMRSILAYSHRYRDKSLIEKCHGMLEIFDKDHPLKFYTRELLFSEEARARYIEPDITDVNLYFEKNDFDYKNFDQL